MIIMSEKISTSVNEQGCQLLVVVCYGIVERCLSFVVLGKRYMFDVCNGITFITRQRLVRLWIDPRVKPEDLSCIDTSMMSDKVLEVLCDIKIDSSAMKNI